MVRQRSLPIILLQRQKNSRRHYVFLTACNEKFQRANAQSYAHAANVNANKAG